MSGARRADSGSALRPVLAIAGIVVAGLLLVSGAYGFHRDELYFIVAGRHPAFGYVDQPPFTPLVSAAAVALLGASPTAVRILPALVVGALVVLTALTARDLGASRGGQIVAAAVIALSGLLIAGHLAGTGTYDLLVWALALWLVVRLLDRADPRLWLAVGLVLGIGLENKHIPLFLGAGLAVGLVLARRWDVLRSPWPWLGAIVAILIWAPNLAWQAANGWPQLEMARAIAGGADENRGKLLPELLLFAGPLLFPVTVAGVWWLFRSPAARPWRAIAWAFAAVLAAIVVSGGKSYYVVGFFPVLMAAGAIVVDGWLDRGRRRMRTTAFIAAAALSGLAIAFLVLPLVPAGSLASTPIPDINKESGEQIGWPALVSTVEGVVADLSAEDRSRAVILTANYGEAAALELLGSGLPPVYSGHNGYWDWGPPPADRTVVVLVGEVSTGPFTSGCRFGAQVDNGLGVENEEQGASVTVCTGLGRPWSVIWPGLRHLD